MAQGKVVQIIGAVVDVEFPRDEVPKVYDALKVEGTAQPITLEVQQQLGDGVVRCIALGSTDGLKRNLVVNNTGEGIKVPVGAETLGRIMDVLGTPIDEDGPIGEKDRWVIHRSGAELRRAGHVERTARNRHQGYRPGLPVRARAARSACSAAPASARP